MRERGPKTEETDDRCCVRCCGVVVSPAEVHAFGELVGYCVCATPLVEVKRATATVRSRAEWDAPPALVAVDPGWQLCAVAVYARGTLVLARLLRAAAHEAPRALLPLLREAGLAEERGEPSRLVLERGVVLVEWPRVYPSGRSAKKGTRNPNDVLKVAQSAGAWLGAGAGLGLAARQVEPRAWKGNLDKAVVERRLPEALDPGEKYVLDVALAGLRKDELRNVVDAAAIGAWVLGRVPLAPRDPRLLET